MTSEAMKRAIKKWDATKGVTQYTRVRVYRELNEQLKAGASIEHISVNEFLSKILVQYKEKLEKSRKS